MLAGALQALMRRSVIWNSVRDGPTRDLSEESVDGMEVCLIVMFC